MTPVLTRVRLSPQLVNENCDLKITDFGLSRGLSHSEQLDFMTEYVVTRWYRAPEIVLMSDTYSKAVDMWSAGCIFAELLGRKPLFPGSDHVQQLTCILEVLGTPCESQMSHVPERARRYIAALSHCEGKPFEDLYPDANEKALSLLSKMLSWDPADRCTVEEALSHPYLAAFHNPAAEPVAAAPFNFDTEEEADPKVALFREVCHFRPELRAYVPEQKAKRLRQPLEHARAEYERDLPRYGERRGMV